MKTFYVKVNNVKICKKLVEVAISKNWTWTNCFEKYRTPISVETICKYYTLAFYGDGQLALYNAEIGRDYIDEIKALIIISGLKLKRRPKWLQKK